jgi:hypothetical protein
LAFEAGALAKSVSIAKVVPLCMDLPTSDLTGPLKEFQGRCLDEPDVKRLVQDLNKATEKQLGKERLDRIFDRWWPDLKDAIDQALEGGQLPPQKPEREPVDMLAELIDRVRRIERGSSPYYQNVGLSGGLRTISWGNGRRVTIRASSEGDIQKLRAIADELEEKRAKETHDKPTGPS